jgi:hypothetical protein
MTNEEIMAEFEELFGDGSESDETEETETEETENSEEETTDDSEETTDSEETEEESEEENSDTSVETNADSSAKDRAASKKAKQNYAFAEQRLQIKQNEQFIRSLGKLVGLDDGASIEDIQTRIKDALIAKEAKDQGISVELAKRLDRAEELIQENDRIKLEKKVQEDFSDLIDKYNLDEDSVNDFTSHLINEGKNPLVDSSVDIESEFLKLHYEDLVQSAVKEALAKEANRKKKVEEKAASGVGSSASEKENKKVSSIKELDDLFNGMEI